MDLSLKLMPFQAEGVDTLEKHERFLLAWSPGVGKTPTAVRACARVKAQNILVFCPPIATSVWRKHFLDWSGYGDVRVLDSTNALTPYGFINGTGVRIIPYSRAGVSHPVISAAASFSDKWDVVILDEAHYLKNPDAKRTRNIYGPKLDLKGSPLEDAKRIWCLTGTPLLNGPHEQWTHLHALKPELIKFPGLGMMGYQSFVNRYCHVRHTSYGMHVVGAKNTTELAHKIKGFTDRKRAQDVLLDLPPLRIGTYELPEDQVEISSELSKALGDLDIEGFDDDELLAAMQNVQTSTARRLVGLAKVPGVVELVTTTLESGPGKLIVFAHHRSVVAELKDELSKWHPLVIIGGDTPRTRDAAIEEFQTVPKRRLIILSIEAASEAITLHAANQVIIAEPSPVPSRNAQAISRAHRKGQRDAVLAQFVTLPGVFDARFMDLISRKTRDIMKIVDPDMIASDPAQPSFPSLMEDQPI